MCAICASLSLKAQSNIIETRSANEQNGKILTMEETILSKELAPDDLRCRWNDDNTLVIYQDGKWLKYDIETGDTVTYRPSRPKPYAFSKDKSIHLVTEDGQHD